VPAGYAAFSSADAASVVVVSAAVVAAAVVAAVVLALLLEQPARLAASIKLNTIAVVFFILLFSPSCV
jgi:hypothetical protein